MGGRCSNTNYQSLMATLQVGGCFVNPLAGGISGLFSTVATAQGCITSMLATLLPYVAEPWYAAALVSITAVQTSQTSFTVNAMTPFQAHSNFLSGVSQTFPTAALAGVIGSVPNGALIGSMSFSGLMGTVSASAQVTSALCLQDPVNPCAIVNSVFSTVTGSFASTLNSIGTGMAAIQNTICTNAALIAAAVSQGVLAVEAAVTAFTSLAAGLISAAAAFAATIVNQIIGDLTNLASSILTALNFGLATSLVSLNANPCFANVVVNIGTPSLQAAIAVASH